MVCAHKRKASLCPVKISWVYKEKQADSQKLELN